jgi:hypothetical protein
MHTLLINLEKYAENSNTLTQTVKYTFKKKISYDYLYILIAYDLQKITEVKLFTYLYIYLCCSSFCAFNVELPTARPNFA